MQHPVLHSKRNLSIYMITWLLICSTHAIVLKQLCNITLSMALVDAAITDVLLAGIGMLCWYTVRFISIDTGHPILIVFNHIISAVAFVCIWHGLTMALLILLNADPGYSIWLHKSFAFRITGGLLFYCIIALLYYLYKYYHSLKTRISKEADWNTMLKEGELALLKSQLQPHFIFNSLNSIHTLMQSNPKGAQEMVLNLASFLRLSMDQDKQKLVSLSEELENSSLYSGIEKIRFADRLSIEKTIEESALACTIPHMILQPVIENAIKHGLFENTSTVMIQIVATATNDYLNLSVSNNYESVVPKQKGKGIGLDHIRRRLMLQYGRKDLMQITDENGIFQIELRIPQY